MTIPLEVEGQVINSSHIGHTVKVADDQEATGGFLIYEWWQESSGPNQNGAFDSWVESEADLEQFFVESGWVVQWSHLTHHSSGTPNGAP
jgi:hypothetical protein